jgi:hypothetical protein
MYRVLDVPQAIGSLPPASGKFTFSVHDPDLPENNGPWEVSSASGSVRVGAAESAELEFTPQTLIQALLGEPSFEDLVRNGVLSANPAAGALFPPNPTYCIDYF